MGFISDTHLPHVLTPDRYGSPEQLRSELERLFLPAWHCVGHLGELPRDGDFKTLELFDLPLLIWRQGDQLQTFLNVCPHRHSMLTSAGCGNLPLLRCQYHGWEFDQTGNTRKIPDARSFRPLAAGQLGLTKYPTRQAGDLIFTCLAPQPPDFDQSLAPRGDLFTQWFGPDRQHVLTTDDEVPADWKLVMENAIEGYHVESVHPKTFGKLAEATDCDHELGDDWTWYSEQMYPRDLDRRVHRWLGLELDDRYQIFHRFPNLLIGKMALFQWVFAVFPLGPRRSRLITHTFCQTAPRPTWYRRLLTRRVVSWGRRFFRRVLDEDLAIMAALQRGLASPEHASGGLISVREERLFQFQRYIQRATQGVAAGNAADCAADSIHDT